MIWPIIVITTRLCIAPITVACGQLGTNAGIESIPQYTRALHDLAENIHRGQPHRGDFYAQTPGKRIEILP